MNFNEKEFAFTRLQWKPFPNSVLSFHTDSLPLLFISVYEKQMQDVCSFLWGGISNTNEIQIMLKQIIKKLKFMALNNSWNENHHLDASEDHMHLRREIRYSEERKQQHLNYKHLKHKDGALGKSCNSSKPKPHYLILKHALMK